MAILKGNHATTELEGLGNQTRLVLIHTGITRAVDVSDYPFGWQEFLGRIGEVAAKKTSGA